jgi:hypothetical protein
MATVNRLTPEQFCHDMGISVRGLTFIEAPAIERLQRISDLEDDQIGDLISWTGRRTGDFRSQFRGEIILTRAIRSPDVRGCPICLKEDALASDGNPAENMAMKGDWLLRHTKACVEHGHVIVPFWNHTRLTARYVSDAIVRASENILDGTFDQPRIVPSTYDAWLDQRLEHRKDNTWLRNFSMHSVATVALQFGRCLQIQRDRHAVASLQNDHAACTVGFGQMAVGRKRFLKRLEKIADKAVAERKGHSVAFGPLHRNLLDNYSNDPDFEWITSAIRDIVSKRWLTPALTQVLGRAVDHSKMHSVSTAARALGLHPNRTRTLLEAEGIIPKADTRTDSQIIFPADSIDGLGDKIATLVDLKTLRKIFGATEFQFKVLIREEIFAPTIQRSRARKAWDPEPVLLFLEWFRKTAIDISTNNTGWEHLHSAAINRRTTVTSLIDAIKDGRMQAGRNVNLEGYAGLFVKSAEVDALSIRDGPI